MSVAGTVCMHSHTASSVNLQQLIIFIVKYLQNICMYELCIEEKAVHYGLCIFCSHESPFVSVIYAMKQTRFLLICLTS